MGQVDDTDGRPGSWLQDRRAAAGLTQEELAERSGLSVRTIRDLESGIRRPHPRSVRLVAGALGLPETAAGTLIDAFRTTRKRDTPPARQFSNGMAVGGQQAAAGNPGREPPGLGPVVVPRQLPTAIAHFAGRSNELAILDQWLEHRPAAQGAVPVAAICGMAGMGKTALALHWAHRVADRFPNGQLYVNLGGYESSPQPADAAEVVVRFLGALGVAPGQIPADIQGLTALYRSVLADQRILIVADNARDAAQVRPLLPGASGCMVLVTSRSPLTGLVAAEGACILNLGVPTADEAAELLRGRLGGDRVAAEPRAISELISGCDRLPLALAVVAARAVASGWPLAALAAELADARKRLGALQHQDPTTNVELVFSWSCRQLSSSARRVFQLLSDHPGPDISAAATASLAGIATPAAAAALRELAAVSLIAEHMPGRYVMHDLLRAYAADQAEASLDGNERQAAVRRMLDHYLHTAEAAARIIDPAHEIITLGLAQCGVSPEDIADSSTALAWFAAEHKVLLAIARLATGPDTTAYGLHLPWTLVSFLDGAGHWHDLVASQNDALARAQRLDDPAGQARTHRHLGQAYLRLGQATLAHAHLTQAAELSSYLGDQAAEARAHLGLSMAFEHDGQLSRSLSSSLLALDLAETAGDILLQGWACNNAGYDHAKLGAHLQGLAYCQRALDLLRKADQPILEAMTWDSLGYIDRCLGNHHQAANSYQRAIALFTTASARYQTARSLTALGDTYHAEGNTQDARGTWQQALAILDDLSHAYASQVRGRLQQ
jgi:tetratricopeptide (TPR) repeat protein